MSWTAKQILVHYVTNIINTYHTHIHTPPFHGPGFCLGLPGWASTRKVKPIWIYWSKRVSGSGISWAICKSAPRSDR